MSQPAKTVSVRFDGPVKNFRITGQVSAAPARPNSASTQTGNAGPMVNDDAASTRQIEELFGQLHERLAQLEVSRSESMTVIHQIAIELSVAIAGKIMFSEIQEGKFPIREMIDELLGTADPAEQVTVYLNPIDLSLLQASRGEDAPSKTDDPVKWSSGADLKRGSARMDLSRYSLFYDGVLQLNEIRQSLLEMANDAEIERRKSGVGSSSLRRFPDRRASG